LGSKLCPGGKLINKSNTDEIYLLSLKISQLEKLTTPEIKESDWRRLNGTTR
jgi:hypothetical protein